KDRGHARLDFGVRAVDLQLVKDAVDHVLYRLDGDDEPLGYRAVAVSFGDQPEGLKLAARQPGKGALRPDVKGLDNLRIDDDLPPGRSFDCPPQGGDAYVGIF